MGLEERGRWRRLIGRDAELAGHVGWGAGCPGGRGTGGGLGARRGEGADGARPAWRGKQQGLWRRVGRASRDDGRVSGQISERVLAFVARRGGLLDAEHRQVVEAGSRKREQYSPSRNPPGPRLSTPTAWLTSLPSFCYPHLRAFPLTTTILPFISIITLCTRSTTTMPQCSLSQPGHRVPAVIVP